jgi:lipoprotein-anchoring transpeptidase ErfK/SrfK
MSRGRIKISVAAVLCVCVCAVAVEAQERGTPARPGRMQTVGTTANDWHESARSDKFTGGRIEQAELVEGNTDLEITVDVPAFRLTLWQGGREVKTYRIGVGMKDHPIVIGEREATEVIWNPAWIPPDSDWVDEMKGIKRGETIKASDPRNPLGKVKIPLGGGYLIHQAKGVSDLGHLVSHGCVRMLRSDLYDLAEKIIAAYSWPVSPKQVARAKLSKKTLVARLAESLPVDINYDTQVIEGGRLHIYPDVYERGTNTVRRLRAELDASRVDTSALDDRTLARMLSRAGKGKKFVVDIASIEAGSALADGRLEPLIEQPVRKRSATKTRAATR